MSHRGSRTVTAALAAVTAGAALTGCGPDPSQVAPAPDRCLVEPGAAPLDVDTDDTPEAPWGHVPGQEVTIYFATGGLPPRYAAFVEEGAALWSGNPCVEAVAVAECPDGSNCSTVVAKARGDEESDDSDGESEGVDRDGVRVANTIRLYTDALDPEPDAGALAAVVHEMGHALGLEHRDDPGSVMSAVTDGDPDPRPDAVDVANLVVLYGAQAG